MARKSETLNAQLVREGMGKKVANTGARVAAPCVISCHQEEGGTPSAAEPPVGQGEATSAPTLSAAGKAATSAAMREGRGSEGLHQGSEVALAQR